MCDRMTKEVFTPAPADWFQDEESSSQTTSCSREMITNSVKFLTENDAKHSPDTASSCDIFTPFVTAKSLAAARKDGSEEGQIADRNYNRSTGNHTTREGGSVTTSPVPEMEKSLPTNTSLLPSMLIDPSTTDSIKVVGSPRPAPSWKEMSSQVLPAAARELLSSSLRKVWRTAHTTYIQGRNKCLTPAYRDIHQISGFHKESLQLPDYLPELPACSSLSWIERQMVREWRTYRHDDNDDDTFSDHGEQECDEEEQVSDEQDFETARTLVPSAMQRPQWQRADACHFCNQTFGPTKLRHHCRKCGHSVCQIHSSQTHRLPHLGYDPQLPERVCDICKQILMEQNLAERVAWRIARCRDLQQHKLVPYFEIGVDTLDQVALRVAQAAIAMAKSIPLGAQATIAVETVDVLRKYGLNGIYTIMLRQEFLAAADLLQKALGINHASWPLSVHELSAAIFYALAQHRAMRGMNPELEYNLHRTSQDINEETGKADNDSTGGVCESLSDQELKSLLFYAPLALNFVYSAKEVDMQLLAAQQGWRLLYAHLDGDTESHDLERPASAVFVHEGENVACIAIRGTSTIHDVITDIRQIPVPFPENDPELSNKEEGDWTTVFRGQGLAVSGMAGAAVNLYREHIDAISTLAGRGYKIRIVGHSLGGGVATLLGVLVHRDLKRNAEKISIDGTQEIGDLLQVYAFGTPSCVDSKLADFVESFVTTVVHHDDVIPRLTPSSCRGLLKHLLHIRETWVKEHLNDDIMAVTERARLVWAPRWREGFTLASSSRTIKRFCKKNYRIGKKKLLSVKEQLVGECLGDNAGELCQDSDQSPCELSPRPMVDVIGNVDKSTEAIVMEEDEFFDACDELLEEDDNGFFDDACNELEAPSTDTSTGQIEGETQEDAPGVVLLEESPLPKMFIPGKIIHIYSHRGVYKAAQTPKNFRELRSISLAGNMLSDHKCKSYYEGLLEVRSVRNATENPPLWVPFDEDDTW